MALVAAGCDQRALVTALWMANAVQVESFPNATKVRSLAKRMRDLAYEISRLEASNFLVWQTEQGIKRVYPVLYIKWATNGRPFYEKVATQLRLSDIDDVKSVAKFQREVRAFDYPLTTSDIAASVQAQTDILCRHPPRANG